MSKIQLVTDTGHNLPESIAALIPMIEVPFWIQVGEELHRDNDISLAFLAGLLERSKGGYPTTSAALQNDFVQAYKASENLNGVLVITIGSNFSATYSNAVTAIGMYQEEGGKLPIKVVNSCGGTMTQGFLLMEAYKLISEGKPLEDIAERLRLLAMTRSNLVFTTRETTYLFRSGRVSRGRHLLASAIRIKPVLVLEDGNVTQLERVRTEKKAIARVAEEVITRSGGQIEQLAIIGGYQTDNQEKSLQAQITSGLKQTPESIIKARMCPAFMINVGPHSVGAAWI